MKRMGWSWPEYCALPVTYLPPLMEYIKRIDNEARRANKARRR